MPNPDIDIQYMLEDGAEYDWYLNWLYPRHGTKTKSATFWKQQIYVDLTLRASVSCNK